MTRKGLSAIITLLALVSVQTPMRAYTLEYRDSAGIVAGRWLTKPIIISFSTSLNSPPPNIKPGSDVIGAVRNALECEAREHHLDFTSIIMRGHGHELPPEYLALLGQWVRGEKLPEPGKN